MIKKPIPGLTNKEILLEKAKNRLHIFLMADDHVRGAFLSGGYMLREMQVQHELGLPETYILGQAFLGVALMASNLKKNDRIAFRIECAGPIKGLSVEADSAGEVRGYLKANPILMDNALEDLQLSHLFGEGFLTVTHFPEYARHPYSGHVRLKYGNIPRDLAHYYSTSEQTPSAFNLSIAFDPDGNIRGAGGLMIQTLPGFDLKLLDLLEETIYNIPGIGEALADGVDPEIFINSHLGRFAPKIVGARRVEFYCRCGKEGLSQILAKLNRSSLRDMAENGPFPIETRCHYCNTFYTFSREELEHIYLKSLETRSHKPGDDDDEIQSGEA